MDLRESIERRLKEHGRGYVFTRKDLLDLASSGTLGRILARLVEDGTIRRIDRGLFDYPRVNEELGGQLSPDIDQVAEALARKFRWTIVPHGALAANRLGLRQQIPAKYVYLSDGPTKQIKAGNRTIRFQHARPKDLRADRVLSATVIQALRHIGRDAIDHDTIRRLARTLTVQDRKRLVEDTKYGTDWIHQVAKQLAGSE
ncbi:MAG TPA: DUF6088 family protein [Phycisphaerae bacterium]|nr:DUF6088 family protein [Phycisphaerae bacterium]